MIKALFNHGVEKDWIITNPASKIKPYPVKKSRKYIPPEEDVIKVLKLAKKEQLLYLTVIINTMGRIREINKLKWEDIKDNYLILRTKKSKNSDIKERVIPINQELKEALAQIPKLSDYVFINPTNGKPYDYRKKFLKNFCRKAGVKGFTFHTLRHFGASRLAKTGGPLTDIQALLGHQRATTTDIYLQSIGQGIIDAVQSLKINSPI